ncbi:MAG: LysR family transcriptional regulator [Planctomycetes bacterium]|nr:LysR family transcriptional regulator [Planctomycetota bacterium]
MTPGAPKRRRRSSPEEGPTIYKCDQLLRMLEEALRNRSKRHATTDPVKFLGNYLPVRETSGKPRVKGDEDENPNAARFHSFCKQLAEALGVSKEFILERITQGLLQDEVQLKELCDHLTAATEHYDLAMSLIKDEPMNRPVTIRIGTTNLINMRVLPAVLEAVRQKFRTAYPETQIRFVQTIMDSDELLFGAQPLVGVDAIVASCLDARVGTIPRSELVTSLPLRYCLLRQRDSESHDSTDPQTLDSWEALRGTAMVALATRRKHFDVPWPDLEAMMESIEEVPTLLEAHARVAASDAWTMSYRELMDDVDERTLEVMDLPREPHRQTSHIVAVLPQVKRRRGRTTAKSDDDAGVEKRMALAILKDCLQTAFTQKKKARLEAEELSGWLARFPFSYHISDYAPSKGMESQRMWFAGRANLVCTTNGNLTGAFTVGNPSGEPLYVRVFGRPISHHDGSVWHLQWRGVDPHEESGTTNMVVTASDLKDEAYLMGSWVGRSSWTDGTIHPSGGPFILHSRSDLTPRDLRRLVSAHQDSCIPDLRRLSTELVPLNPAKVPSAPKKPR